MLLAQSAVDRFKNAAFAFVVEGESYRPRLKPKLDPEAPPPPEPHDKLPCRQGAGGVVDPHLVQGGLPL